MGDRLVPPNRAELRAIARARLSAQGLVPGFGRAAGLAPTVAWMGMMQAQDLRQAFWALGVRQPGSRASEVRAALNQGSVVRTWGARGTLMLLAPVDVHLVLSVTGERMYAAGAARRRELGISEQDVDALAPVAVERCGERGATREQLFQAFRAAGQPTSGQRGIHLLFALSVRRILIQGPLVDDGATHGQLFVRYGRWLGPQAAGEPATSAEALRTLAVRYFRSHGPATERDLAWWLGLPVRPVRAALAAIAESPGTLLARVIGGETHWMDPRAGAFLDAAGPPAPGSRSVLALPGFDELLLGYRDRSATLPPRHADRVVPGGNGVFRRILVAGGTAVGTWSVGGTRTKPLCVAEPFEDPLAPGHSRAFAARAREHVAFLAG